jgi:[ribosomal protein S18]-alanine N-acetyltransferase
MPELSTNDMAAIHAASFTTPRPWSGAEIDSLLQSRFVFALCESQGFLLGRALAGEAELLTLAVDPAARRQGLGAKLVSGFLAQARLRDATTAFLEVAADNLAAQSLYLGIGFTLSGRRKGYYHALDGTKQDALVFTRAL